MARRRSRGTGYLGTDRGLREIQPRFGLDNAARSTSTATHNRRKPGLLSVDTAELANNISINSKLPDNEIGSAKIAGLEANKINGNIAAGQLPGGILIGKANSNTEIDWRGRSVPDAALSKDYAPADSVQAIKQQVSGFQNQIQNLKRQVQQLSQGKKKKN